jgi:hypothetical protein
MTSSNYEENNKQPYSDDIQSQEVLDKQKSAHDEKIAKLRLMYADTEVQTVLAKIAEGPDRVTFRVRYWTRLLDMILYLLTLTFLATIVNPDIFLQIHILSFLTIAVFLFPFLEAALMATWGTLPIKALMRIKVRNSNDKSKLSYFKAIVRGYYVLVIGIGMLIPYLGIFVIYPLIKDDISSNGTTPWDHFGKYKVTQGTIGTLRKMLLILIWIGCFFMILHMIK